MGHIHHIWRFQLNMFNVGVDTNHFYPVNMADIPFHYKAIVEYYDSDAWVGYNEINSAWRESRGKKSSYFNGN